MGNIPAEFKELVKFGLVFGIVGVVGYVLKAAANMNDVANKIGMSVDDMSHSVHIDVSEMVVNDAVRKVAEQKASQIVDRSVALVVKAVKDDIFSKTKAAVDKAYSNVEDSVRRELKRQAENLDIDDLKDEIIEKAKQEAVDKFGDALDSVLDIFQGRNNAVSENVSVKDAMEAIYQQAEKMSFSDDKIAAAKKIQRILKSVKNDSVKAFGVNLLVKLADKCSFSDDKNAILALVTDLYA